MTHNYFCLKRDHNIMKDIIKDFMNEIDLEHEHVLT